MSVTYQDIQSAAQILDGNANHTPAITSRTLNTCIQAHAYLKCENLQRIGAFKFRGAYNAISHLTDQQKTKGVITYSSGNHAQAIALSGKLHGVATTIVMPNNAPATKLAATRDYGATVVIYDTETQNREEVANQLKSEHGYTLIPPYDHPHVIAGQGTAAKELIEEVGELDTLLVCCGGGGLLSGSALSAKALSPNCTVIGVEPEVADDATRSFKTGILHTVKNPPTIADGTRTPSLGKLTFPLVLANVDDMVTVSEDAIKEAVRFAFYRLKMVMEPSGVLGLAALLSQAYIPQSPTEKIGVIISGGNIDAPTLTTILQEPHTT